MSYQVYIAIELRKNYEDFLPANRISKGEAMKMEE